MMHGSMAFMMIFMWLFWLLLIGGVIAAVVLAARALRESRRLTVSLSRPFTRVPDPSPLAYVEPLRPGPASPVSERDLGLLDDDLRRLYGLVAERGGEVPQGDLVALTGWSKAKVSKALDRLEAKGLIVRLRRGMSNRVVTGPKAVS